MEYFIYYLSLIIIAIAIVIFIVKKITMEKAFKELKNSSGYEVAFKIHEKIHELGRKFSILFIALATIMVFIRYAIVYQGIDIEYRPSEWPIIPVIYAIFNLVPFLVIFFVQYKKGLKWTFFIIIVLYYFSDVYMRSSNTPAPAFVVFTPDIICSLTSFIFAFVYPKEGLIAIKEKINSSGHEVALKSKEALVQEGFSVKEPVMPLQEDPYSELDRIETTDEWFKKRLEILDKVKDSVYDNPKYLALKTLVLGSGREDVMDVLTQHTNWIPSANDMHMAATGGYIVAMKWLQKRGVAINANTNDNEGYMPIHIAASGGHIEAVKWLLDNGAKVNDKSKKNRTPMHQAAVFGKIEIMRYLKERGADLYVRDDDGRSPMELAVIANQIESIKCLKELGADVDARDNDDDTPLFIAAMGDEKGGKIESMKCLASLGADVNAKGKLDKTPMFLAARAGHVDSVKCLESLGADLNAVDDYGTTPVFEAVMMGHTEVIKCLKSLGVDVNGKLENGMTPIFAAAATGQITSMECLKELGADLAIRNNDNQTVLDFAVSIDQFKAAEWLRDNGAR